MALLTVTDNKLTLATFQTAAADDTVEFRGATLTVAAPTWEEIEGEGIVMELQLLDSNSRVRGRLIKTITPDDAGYEDALTELGG